SRVSDYSVRLRQRRRGPTADAKRGSGARKRDPPPDGCADLRRGSIAVGVRPRDEGCQIHLARGAARGAANPLDDMETQATVALELRFVEELIGRRLMGKFLVFRRVMVHIGRFV